MQKMMTFTVIGTRTNRKSYPRLLVNSTPANFTASRRSKKVGRQLNRRKRRLILSFRRGRGEERKSSRRARRRKACTKWRRSPRRKLRAVGSANSKAERADRLSEPLQIQQKRIFRPRSRRRRERRRKTPFIKLPTIWKKTTNHRAKTKM